MRSVHVVLVAGILLAGCSPADPGDGHPAAHAAAAVPDRPLDLCQLMPLADVAGVLQANGADTVTEQKAGPGGMCSYLHVPRPGDYRAKLLIDFTRMPSAGQAQAALAMQRRDFADRGTAVTAIPGLGDEAFVAETEGNEGLKLRVGPYVGQINLGIEGRPPASLRPAVQALGRQVVGRLR
ncbi:MAG TPA: hypothetical protein VGU65_07325 [Frateuria sp.]|uniref:hypothetical protein n=1 Tax=Frateuria sp. TaxID=2211372 RepID=UPI002DE8D755|nr:hypothetical protein [Frateuria sp.]